MDPQAALEGARMAADTLAQMLDVDEWNSSAEHDEAVQGIANDLLTNFRSLDDWLSQGGFKPEDWRRHDQQEHLYEKCRYCHLFVEPNEAHTKGSNIATHVHLARGDDADEKLDAEHEPTPSGLRATLDTWRVFGPWQMRERFVVKP